MESFRLYSLGQPNLALFSQDFGINRACCKLTSKQQHRPQLKNSHWKSSHPSRHTPLSNEVRDVLAIPFSTQLVTTQLELLMLECSLKLTATSWVNIPVLPTIYLTVSLASTRHNRKPYVTWCSLVEVLVLSKHHWEASSDFSNIWEKNPPQAVSKAKNPRRLCTNVLFHFCQSPDSSVCVRQKHIIWYHIISSVLWAHGDYLGTTLSKSTNSVGSGPAEIQITLETLWEEANRIST